MAKDAYYFSHDSNARHDPKILSMRSVYGSEGYGWYWIIIEMLREQEDYKIMLNKYVWNALAMQTQCEANAMHTFVEDCINEFKLFESDGESFWSESLNRRMVIRNDKSEKARKAAEARWGKSSNDKVSTNSDESQSNSNANAMQTHSERNAIKGKESKVNKSKEKENISYVDIIDYLNLKTQSSYKASTKKTKDLINARYNEGFKLEDFKQVIDNKTAEWLNDSNMNKYLRPETLFGNKFESYLNQKGGGPPNGPKENVRDILSKYNFDKKRELKF